jgi:hypothetical protein
MMRRQTAIGNGIVNVNVTNNGTGFQNHERNDC